MSEKSNDIGLNLRMVNLRYKLGNFLTINQFSIVLLKPQP